MEQELTTVEARGGVVNGRVALVQVSSFVGTVFEVGLCWALLIPHG